MYCSILIRLHLIMCQIFYRTTENMVSLWSYQRQKWFHQIKRTSCCSEMICVDLFVCQHREEVKRLLLSRVMLHEKQTYFTSMHAQHNVAVYIFLWSVTAVLRVNHKLFKTKLQYSSLRIPAYEFVYYRPMTQGSMERINPTSSRAAWLRKHCGHWWYP